MFKKNPRQSKLSRIGMMIPNSFLRFSQQLLYKKSALCALFPPFLLATLVGQQKKLNEYTSLSHYFYPHYCKLVKQLHITQYVGSRRRMCDNQDRRLHASISWTFWTPNKKLLPINIDYFCNFFLMRRFDCLLPKKRTKAIIAKVLFLTNIYKNMLYFSSLHEELVKTRHKVFVNKKKESSQY